MRPTTPSTLQSSWGWREIRRRDYLYRDPGPSQEFPEGLFLVVAVPSVLPRGGRAAVAEQMLRAERPRVFRALLGMGGGGKVLDPADCPRQSRQVGGSEARVAPPGSSGRLFFHVQKEVPSAGRHPSAAGARPGVVSTGEEVPGHSGLRHSGAGTAGWAGGRRWRPRGRALGGAGCRWPGCARGGAGGGSDRAGEAEGRRAAGPGR